MLQRCRSDSTARVAFRSLVGAALAALVLLAAASPAESQRRSDRDRSRSGDLSTGMFLLDASVSANYRFPAFEADDDRDDDGRGRRGRSSRIDRGNRGDRGDGSSMTFSVSSIFTEVSR